VTSQRCIPLESSAEWKEALHGIKHAFAHTWENCYAMHLTTGFRTYLYCFETENVRVVCPIAEREFDGYIDIVTPYGFSGFVGNGHYPQFPLFWRQFVKERGYVCGYIALNPIFETSVYFNSNEAYRSNTLYFLDLTLSIDELFSKLDRNRKRELKDFNKHVFVLDRDTLIDFFLETYPEFLRRVQAPPASYFTMETLTTPEGRRHATALLWWGVNHLKAKRVPLLNLGGGVRENDTIARSKERFGPIKLPFRPLKQIYDRRIYEELCQQRGVDPDDRTGYFPAYRSLTAQRN
jgi:hypothetical protein